MYMLSSRIVFRYKTKYQIVKDAVSCNRHTDRCAWRFILIVFDFDVLLIMYIHVPTVFVFNIHCVFINTFPLYENTQYDVQLGYNTCTGTYKYIT
jgi:hypothetical protein